MPAFAEHEIGIVVGQDVFARQQPFLDSHGQAALEQDGLAGFGGGDEELEILGIARADLDDVGVFGHQFGVAFGKQFGDDGQPGFAAGFGQQFQPLFAQALEFIGGGAGFESAAAQDGCARPS